MSDVTMEETSGKVERDDVAEPDFRMALGRFASGVTVITTTDEVGAIHGMTATAFSSLSLRPPLILVAVASGTRCHALLGARRAFGVSILADHQCDVSRHFGGRPSSAIKLEFTLVGGVPVLVDALATLTCRLRQSIVGGDHSIFVGHVETAKVREGMPLVHHRGRYCGLVELS